MDTSEFREIFAAEARDYLQSLNENLLHLEQRPNDRRILDDMFRAAHSLKGMAATMGFQELASLTHEMESVLDLMRTSRLAVEQRVVDVLFRSVDALEELLESTLAGTSAAISTHLIQQLRQLTDTAPGAQAEVQVETDRGFRLDAFDLDTINQAGAQGLKAYAVHITLRPNTLLKSVRVFTIFQALETIGTIIKSYPPAHDLEDERFDLDFSLLVLTAEQSSSVQQLVEGISEIDAVEVEEVRVSQGQARSEAAAALEPSSGSSDFLKAAQVQQRGSDKYV